YDNIAMLPWNCQGGFDRAQFDTLNLERKCIPCTIREDVQRGGRGSSIAYLSMAYDTSFWCHGCSATVTTKTPLLRRQERAGLCLACFETANPGWIAFKERLDTRLKRAQRYESYLLNVTSGRHDRPRKTGARETTGPRPPQDDLQEDWALWRDVFEGPPDQDLVVLHARFAAATRGMQRYLTWMRTVDDEKAVCQHKAAMPLMDKLAELGPWPAWEDIRRQMEGSPSGLGTGPCRRYCKAQYSSLSV
ncbi:hypothetical protein LTR53_017005, partial [Teratosphaeriaceae sp. CCFEE 6253]